jgi:hypothetical protein
MRIRRSILQTFVPENTFEHSVRVLDRQRLGKQRVETLQIMKALAGLIIRMLLLMSGFVVVIRIRVMIRLCMCILRPLILMLV